MNNEELILTAIKAREQSYSKYSGFSVGAALQCSDGKVYYGSNIENASFGLTNCAERTAFFKAVSEGERKFEKIAIVGGDDFCPPCGACRQVMAEFCNGDFKVILAKNKDEYVEKKLSELLPFSFEL